MSGCGHRHRVPQRARACELRALRRVARGMTVPEVEIIIEVTDVKLVTDDDGLPTGWSACRTCGQPTRHTDEVCGECRLDITVARMIRDGAVW